MRTKHVAYTAVPSTVNRKKAKTSKMRVRKRGIGPVIAISECVASGAWASGDLFECGASPTLTEACTKVELLS